jgi:hypothetical protein
MQIIVSLFAVSSAATSLACEQLLGWPASSWPSLLAAGTVFVSLAMLAKVSVARAPTCIGML